MYRVFFKFRGHGLSYYTEWFDTLAEAEEFVVDAAGDANVFHIENADGEIV